MEEKGDPITDAGSVLVVEDSPFVQEIVSRALRQNGFEYRPAQTGAEALREIEKSEIDAILLDLVLPDIQGMELLGRLKTISPDTEVIILTGNASLNSAVEAIDRQAFAYLAKPVLPDQIIGTLRKAIEKRLLRADNLRLAKDLEASNQQLEAKIADRTRALELEKRRIQAIMDSLSDAVVMLDREGRLVSVNPAGEAILGIEGSELTGKKIVAGGGPSGNGLEALAEVVADRRSEKSQVFPDRRKARAFDPTWRKEIAIGTRNRRLLEVSSTPVLDRNDSMLGRAFVAHDITGERETGRLKSEFVDLVSHELRAPLSTVMVALEIVQRSKSGQLCEKQIRALEMATGQCRSMNELIDQFLDISKIEANALKPNTRPADVSRVVSDALAQITPLAEEKSIDIASELLHGDAHPSIDEDQIRRVCMILLDNGVKYTPAEGAVSLRAKTEDSRLVIEVSDNGPGIPEEERPHVFEKFYRGVSATTSMRKGSGLGLAFASSIVEKHDGHIGVECPGGGGSRFWVSLPLAGESYSTVSPRTS